MVKNIVVRNIVVDLAYAAFAAVDTAACLVLEIAFPRRFK